MNKRTLLKSIIGLLAVPKTAVSSIFDPWESTQIFDSLDDAFFRLVQNEIDRDILIRMIMLSTTDNDKHAVYDKIASYKWTTKRMVDGRYKVELDNKPSPKMSTNWSMTGNLEQVTKNHHE